MRNQNSRFDDQDLIDLLLIYVTDFNRKPTQRDLLADDRFPTHLTFINRFGSVAKALDQAGVGNFADRSIMHQLFKESNAFQEILSIGGIKVEEFALLNGNIKADFVFTYDDQIVGIIDLIAASQLSGCPFNERILSHREISLSNYTDNVMIIDNIFDQNIDKFIEKLKGEI